MYWTSGNRFTGTPFRAACLGSFAISLILLLPSGAFAQGQEDPYQRSTDVYRYRTAGQSGPARGEAIYYYKCWICHNQYTSTGGPRLKGLFERGTFQTTGQPANDQTVRDKIRSGGPGMPRFETTMTDADIADLISYLKDGKCCFEGEEPPANPRFRAR